ncbi:MAG: LuxR C-terminal-related transcriptional regulator [Thermoleophilia bacterium]
MSAQPTVLVASASPAFAQGLAVFLENGRTRVVQAWCIDDALRNAVMHAHRVALVDRRLADGTAEALIPELALRCPGLRVLCVFDDDEDAPDVRAARLGAAGWVGTGWSRELLLAAVAAAAGGGAPHPVALGPDAALTEQERVVLRLMRQHLTYKEIAQLLGVSWHTVRTHAQSILRKSGVHSRRDLLGWGEPRPADTLRRAA